MKVLFFMRSTVYVRNFESTLRMLAERGHEVQVVAQRHHALDVTDMLGSLSAEYPTITGGVPPVSSEAPLSKLGLEFRRGLDYLRYLEPEYRDAPKLRYRAEQNAPTLRKRPLWRRLEKTSAGRGLLRRVLRAADRAVPRDPGIERFVAAQSPDLVLVTPLVEPGSPQAEYVRAARALGIPVGLCVYSWDNLTNKGLIHDPLDVVTVWNPFMKTEAIALHGVPADRIVVTGAPAYDHWFTWSPRWTRDEFCGRVGLDSRQPYVLYLCSSKFIAPDERSFVRRWIEALRASPVLRDVGVLVRPHPQNVEPWRDVGCEDMVNVAVWPRAGGNPVDAASRAEYYDSIHHSVGVVGVNTSAQIESAIVGRGVFTLLAPEFHDTQSGTLHFRHLCDANGGLLHVADDMASHMSQLESAVRDPLAAAERCRQFVEGFVRPHGLDVPATPLLVEALEAAARRPVHPDRGPWWAGTVEPALARMAARLEPPDGRLGKRARTQPDGRKVKELDRSPGRHKKTSARGQGARTPPAGASEAVSPHVASDPTGAYERYLRVRECLLPLRELESGANAWTPVERRAAAVLASLWDATPAMVSQLRRFAEPLGGARLADYAPAGERTPPVREIRRLLGRGTRALWVEEPAALGGFGFTGIAGLYNEDTLRFFRALMLLDDAALLRQFHAPVRRTVWEIGGGWGGFACQFRTLFPSATYLITAPVECLLLSATYLANLQPSARLRFFQPSRPEAFWQDWNEVDIAFAPESIVPDMSPPALDLTLDLGALERMSSARVEAHLLCAHHRRSPHLLTVSQLDDAARADAATELFDVASRVDRWYWRHPVAAPAYLARRLSLRPTGRAVPGSDYYLGWRRLHTA